MPRLLSFMQTITFTADYFRDCKIKVTISHNMFYFTQLRLNVYISNYAIDSVNIKVINSGRHHTYKTGTQPQPPMLTVTQDCVTFQTIQYFDQEKLIACHKCIVLLP